MKRPRSQTRVHRWEMETERLPNAFVDEDSDNLAEQIRDFILEFQADYKELQTFYPVRIGERVHNLSKYLIKKLRELKDRFEDALCYSKDPQANADYILIRAYLYKIRNELATQDDQLIEVNPFFHSWYRDVADFCENRQTATPMDAKQIASVLAKADERVAKLAAQITSGDFKDTYTKTSAYQATTLIEDLKTHLQEAYDFYAGFDPMFTWWVRRPREDLAGRLSLYISAIREHLVGIKPDTEDPIVGLPAGQEMIDLALQSEFIAYTSEELIGIAEKQYEWCEQQAVEASRQMGFQDDWRAAQEQVKNLYVEPGQQVELVHELAQEAIHYVTEHDMVTVPEFARRYWRTFMMSPARQKVNPFFLGGDSIIVSYPTDSMAHEDKLMSMRANNRHFSRSVVLHELIPGHHLQFHYMARHKTHRQIFQTPFSTEGWAFYWELILWDRGFAATPEDKLGMLFWHMHRCIRIIFSLKFHLGEWTPQQCVDALVERVGHERATAEGEVRRSFDGDYGPLYQVGYMIGALQLLSLRRELVESGRMQEKEFHDRILKENNMPIEILRALLKGVTLPPDYEAKWRFYDT